MTKLFLIISAADPRILTDVALPYIRNAHKNHWMDQIRVILWGPSEKTVVSTLELKAQVMDLANLLGKDLIACKQCAEDYNITDRLEKLNVSLEYVGELITNMLKDDWKQLVF